MTKLTHRGRERGGDIKIETLDRVFINHLGSERVMVSDANDKCHAHHLPPEADHDTWSQAINTIQLIIAIIVINNRSQQQGEL